MTRIRKSKRRWCVRVSDGSQKLLPFYVHFRLVTFTIFTSPCLPRRAAGARRSSPPTFYTYSKLILEALPHLKYLTQGLPLLLEAEALAAHVNCCIAIGSTASAAKRCWRTPLQDASKRFCLHLGSDLEAAITSDRGQKPTVASSQVSSRRR